VDVVSELRAAGCVFAEEEATLLLEAATSDSELVELVTLRVAGLPLEQVVGWAEFCGRRVYVDPGVFVPRRRTEFLVRRAAEFLLPGATIVVDMCCGCGAVGAVLQGLAVGVEVPAVDVDHRAVACAGRNLVGGAVYAGDLFDPLPDRLHGRVDLLVANAPYVPTTQIEFLPAEARLHEPLVALDGGEDGVNVQRRVIAGAMLWLAPAGRLLIETGEQQAHLTAAAMRAAGLPPSSANDPDLAGTVVVGRSSRTI
jgi:release factor glutamine methyltransferase